MKKICFLICFAALTQAGFAQYKYDNVLYKTVFTQDLCNEMKSHPGYLLLDVRTPGEYADTSAMRMNIGRFKNAVNIEVRQLGKRLAEINAYKDKPVFVYSAHSQRSRRASKMLADSGFKQVFNINGGMTGLRQFPHAGYECMYDKMESKNSYKIISAADLCEKISAHAKDIFLLDVRKDSAFRHISLDAKTNAFGYFKNTVNIPLANLEANLTKIPMGKEIIITDLYGDDAALAAALLKKKKYPKVSVLLEGIDRVLSSNPDEATCLSTACVSDIPYKILNAQTLMPFLRIQRGYLFLDARTPEEFANKDKNNWQNVGHLQDAINIPAADIAKDWTKIAAYKTQPVIVYVFGSGTAAYETARILVSKGFENVLVLHGGIFNTGWTAANIKGYSYLADLIVDIPAETPK